MDYKDEVVKQLMEMANMMHPQLKFVPLSVDMVRPYHDEVESKDKFGMLGKMHSTTISAKFTNGEKEKTVAISFLISVVEDDLTQVI